MAKRKGNGSLPPLSGLRLDDIKGFEDDADFSEDNNEQEDLFARALRERMQQPDPQQVKYQEAWDAFRREQNRGMEKLYAQTMKAVGNKLQYGFVPHLLTGAVQGIIDAFCTLYTPVKNISNSPLAREFVREETGEEGNLLDYVLQEVEKRGGENVVTQCKEAFQLMEQPVRYLVQRSEETGKTPEQLVRSPREQYRSLVQRYGSLKTWEQKQREACQKLSHYLDQVETFQHLPLGDVVYTLAKSKLELEFGVPPQALGVALGVSSTMLTTLAQSCLADVLTFGRAYVKATEESVGRGAAKYKKIEEKTKAQHNP